MIVPKAPQLIRMIQYVGRPLFFLALWDLLIVVAFNGLHWTWVGSTHVPLSLYGAAIGIVVGFRNNSAYARWWEARTLWGAIVNKSRTVARLILVTMRAEPGSENELLARQKQLVLYQVAFVHALRQQLRGLDPVEVVRRLITPEDIVGLEKEKNVSLALQRKMGSVLREARGKGWINEWEWQSIEQSLSDLMDAQGGSERIKNTPLPKQYDFFPMLFVQIYCLMLPIGMVENLGWFTPLGSTLVGFMFLALDKIGRDLEDPFDNTIYDVPLTAISTTIEINLRQLLGETELPPPEKPIRGVLW